MRFLEVPALITEDIEDPNILDITETETVTASINGTTLTIDGDSKVSGEVTITLTNDVTVSTVTTSNIRQPSIHKITIKTNGVGNFTYTSRMRWRDGIVGKYNNKNRIGFGNPINNNEWWRNVFGFRFSRLRFSRGKL